MKQTRLSVPREMRIISFIEGPEVIKKILQHLGLKEILR
jgi:hypothetical protein